MIEFPVTLDRATELADLFGSLSDPTRLLILANLLDGELGVGELVERIGISKSAVSHQLKSLRDRRIIRTRRDGRRIFVCLDDAHVIDLLRQGLDHIQHG
jgi:ArsR family transcriptional regulator, lead/cadmium/zinc/bismuth-responsive transcriptional repressor